MAKQTSEIVLTEEQQKAINSHKGVFITWACPGAGKTEILIRRHLAMLLAGIPARDILNLSFTSAAATTMVKRVGLIDSESVFRTFHSLAIEILKKERDHLSFKLCETVIPVGMEDYQLLFDLVKIYPAINWRTLQERITEWKCMDILPDLAIEESENHGVEYFYALAYRDYEIKCRQQGWLDFDDCIREAVNLLSTNEGVRNRWKKKYLAIDEMQDTCENQTAMAQLLFDGNLFCTGDVGQCIFEWRSAAPTTLTDFAKSLPNVEALYLSKNFRSTKALVRFFREIMPEGTGLEDRMDTDNEEGVPPTFTKYRDAEQEADEILKGVKDPTNTAIIARTNRQLYVFQRACLARGVKYKILSKKDYFELNEIKKIVSLAKEKKGDPRPANIVLEELIRQHNLLHLYKHSGKPTEASPAENMNDLVKMSMGKGNIDQFLDKLRKWTHARKSAKGLTLTTAHSSKGREYDVVYAVGLRQGLLPHKDGEITEERRIWYVMCTRAAKELHVSFYDNRSEFLNNYQNQIEEFKAA